MTPNVPSPKPPDVQAPPSNSTPWQEIVAEVEPDLDLLVTEDDTPVDSIFTEKQQRLLTEPLYSSWAGPGEGRLFLALANVGWFYASKQPVVVPDCLLSLDAAPAGALTAREGR